MKGGVKIKNFDKPKLKYYERVTNAYQSLAEFSIDPGPPSEPTSTTTANRQAAPPPDHRSKQKLKVERRRARKLKKQLEKLNQDEFFRAVIQQADDETTVYEDGKTAAAKENNCWKGVNDIDKNVHQKSTPISQFGKKTLRAAASMIRRGLRSFSKKTKRVRFGTKTRVATFVESEAATVFVTYDSGKTTYVSLAKEHRS